MEENYDNDVEAPDINVHKANIKNHIPNIKEETSPGKKSCLTFRSYRRRYLSKLDD